MLELDGAILRDGFRLDARLSAAEGARVAVMGPSGAGKSTLLLAIAGFVPFEGRIAWAGRELGGLRPGERPVSLLFQDNNLFPHLDLAANLGLGLDPRGRLGVAERRKVEAALERVGLGGVGPRRPGTLSGGQQGRAALARALLRARPLMLLDEPFAALGPALRAEMLELVGEVAEETGAAVLMVTHLPEDARLLGESVIVVDEGRAAPPVPVGPLLDDPPEGLRRYLGT
jgi:thiamine transport system ATP-binding protein